MYSRLFYNAASKFLPTPKEPSHIPLPLEASLISSPRGVTGTHIQRLFSSLSRWLWCLYTCLNSLTILDSGSPWHWPWQPAQGQAAGPPSGWSNRLAHCTLPSELYLHLPGAGLPSPLEAGPLQPGPEGGRLGRGGLGGRDTSEITICARTSWLYIFPCRKAGLAVLFRCHKDREK